jgi:hypothetical protein
VPSPILQMDFVDPIIALLTSAFPRGTYTMSPKHNEFCGARSVIVQFAATGAITVGPTSCIYVEPLRVVRYGLMNICIGDGHGT